MFRFAGRFVFAAAFLLLVPSYGFAQGDDDDATPARLEDGSGRPIGRAVIGTSPSMYGLYFKLWLDDGTKLRILHPTEEARRDRPAKFTFRDYKVARANATESGDELGSGVATIEPGKLTRDGDTESFSGSMQLTAKLVGDNEVPVSEPAQRFQIVIR